MAWQTADMIGDGKDELVCQHILEFSGRPVHLSRRSYQNALGGVERTAAGGNDGDQPGGRPDGWRCSSGAVCSKHNRKHNRTQYDQ